MNKRSIKKLIRDYEKNFSCKLYLDQLHELYEISGSADGSQDILFDVTNNAFKAGYMWGYLDAQKGKESSK